MAESPNPFGYFVNFCNSYKIDSSSLNFNSNRPHVLIDKPIATLVNDLVKARHITKLSITIPPL